MIVRDKKTHNGYGMWRENKNTTLNNPGFAFEIFSKNLWFSQVQNSFRKSSGKLCFEGDTEKNKIRWFCLKESVLHRQ